MLLRWAGFRRAQQVEERACQEQLPGSGTVGIMKTDGSSVPSRPWCSVSDLFPSVLETGGWAEGCRPLKHYLGDDMQPTVRWSQRSREAYQTLFGEVIGRYGAGTAW